MNIPVLSRIIKISDTLFELMQIEIKYGNNYFKRSFRKEFCLEMIKATPKTNKKLEKKFF